MPSILTEPMRHIIEARQQVDDGGLARAGGPHNGDGLPGLGGEGDLVQHRHALLVLMGDFVELDPALDLGHGFGVGFIDNGGLFIQDGEDAFGACDGVLDIGPQHGDLLDGLVEALDVGQEGDDQAQGDSGAEQGLSLEQVPAADAGDDGQRDIREGFQRRSQRRGVGDGAHVGIAVGGVDFLELLDVLIGAVEGLHFAYRGDALLQLGVDIADLLAASAEGFACLFGEIQRSQEHDGGNGKREQREGQVGGQHVVRDPDQQQDAAENIDQREREGLLDGAGVVGDAAHQVAGFMLGVVAQREGDGIARILPRAAGAARAGRSTPW